MFSGSRALRGNPEKEKNRFKMRENQSMTVVISWIRCFGQESKLQPGAQACSRYPNDQRRLGTERDRRILPTSLTGDVTSEIAEDNWERG